MADASSKDTVIGDVGGIPSGSMGDCDAINEAEGVTHVAPSRNFSFTKEPQLLMLQAVLLHDAHFAARGKKDMFFGKLHKTLISNGPATM